jgi:3-oxoacyl-[acyl-carrier protein] reductase
MRLSGKAAFITGGAAGIGKSTALLFAREGAKVAVGDIDKKGGLETVDSIRQSGGEALFVEADVSKADDVMRMIAATFDAYGKLDVLFNNAGCEMLRMPTEDIEEDGWDRIMTVNVKSVFLGAKYAIPIMKRQGGGVIINTGSISGLRPRPGASAYAASKGAVISLTKSLAIELAPFRIRVNCINPVVTETPMAARAATDFSKQELMATIPIGRFAQPEEMAYGALYLASDESAMVTGISLNIDGGRGI